jgi:hypothetical protein
MVRYEKRINGTYYVVEAVPDSKTKKLQVVSAYKAETKGSGGQEPDGQKTPKHNVRNELAHSTDNKITDSPAKVNTPVKKSSAVRNSA